MNLEFNVGEEVWAVIDVTLTNDQECPTCGQHVIRSAVARQTALGKILGIDVRIRHLEPTILRYTIDFDGILSDTVLQVFKTKEEADAVLDLNFSDSNLVANF